MDTVKGKVESAQKVVIYGPEGVGKSTFASQFPGAIFIDTEGGTKELDVERTPAPSSWTILLQQVGHYALNPDGIKTLVIDTADWAEMMCVEHICTKASHASLEDFGYGKGYVILAEEFGRLLNRLTELVDKGVHVVLVAHAQMRKFEQPDESGAYDRWELKLQKKTAPLVKEWADMILFANYKTIVVKNEDKKNKAVGGARVMYTSHHPCWDAKNRKGLDEELPFEFKAVAHCFPANSAAKQEPPPKPEQGAFAMPPPEPPQQPQQEPAPMPAPSAPAGPGVPFDDYSGVPKALADLMKAGGASVADVQKAVAYKGYYPEDTPIGNYDPQFISGVLVAAWDQVYGIIQASKEDRPY